MVGFSYLPTPIFNSLGTIQVSATFTVTYADGRKRSLDVLQELQEDLTTGHRMDVMVQVEEEPLSGEVSGPSSSGIKLMASSLALVALMFLILA
jgi:hypothetical protein